MPVRKERNRRLRELAERKNAAFRAGFVGQDLSVVTLGEGRMALSSNYLKVELLRESEANALRNVRIGGVTENGLREFDPLRIL
jgi:tRNA A37 methylthiotransferase MiaB